ncbi:methylmalonyl-CoA mutase family protein [Nocardioides sp. TRM66260-LWL]|uniref:methylmalonyl-CoA mutase family protein n=1 Tax=Nocardioides sp. TRM66260-LWL TaxID=2874478 RepID=UPI001CC75A7A|nr:methylmalonyl-CoA mutase family protein [Nocardioides sp. TRM66260-LWL]MBZ5733249.1 methylmalonyl-CoA mutase family protein [Nocardioides sp. TRM66260-LWL]
MTESDGTLRLAGPDDAWSLADWEAQAATVLRKARRLGEDDPDERVWDRLTRTTLDGIAVTPLGRAADLDGLVTAGRPTRVGPWDIRPHVATTGVAAGVTNETVLADLEGGATSVWLRLAPGAETELEALLAGVYLDLAPVVLDAPHAPLAAARALLAHLESTVPAPGTNLGVDALAEAEELVGAVRLALEAAHPGLLAVVVDATRVHDRGASDAQDVAFLLAAGVRALRVLEEAGIDAATAAPLLEPRLAVTDEQFPSVAKLRAARRLWVRVLELSGVPAEVAAGARQHAVTSRPMLSAHDPYVNMLRTTVAAFAAGVGGAEAVTVLPFDAPLGRPEGFGRRIARNINHLLIEESHLGRVADIAGGAYAVERLTDDLARRAWELFVELDAAVLAGATLDDAIAPLVEETVAARERLVATRTRPITGVSEFPNLAETLPERLADGGFEGVRPYGASYEELRATPPAAHVFLATLGPIAAHTARATFASNLLAAGGVAVDVAGATSGPDDLVAAYTGQPVVCLAGADAAYEEWGAAAAEALRAAGARHVVIAGRATDWSDDSCAMGVDALAFLTRTREALA